MSTSAYPRPSSQEYHPYYRGYVELAPDGDIVASLEEQGQRLVARWRALPPEMHGYRYEKDKWSAAEVLGHIADTERLFSYRAMCFLRGVTEAQPGVDQDVMVPNSGADQRGIPSLVSEFEWQRRANVELFRGLSQAQGDRRGIASDAEITVRALLFILYGHAEHHAAVLRERYVP
ncbi:DinB superfamily protein [Planctomycetes bacterium Poly30]|uniref:DinB superfamily protein n=1 Tax=Saltatorellus ferox TaxID=2528018 RepID=A0A518EKF2_9BACT|nr:DinB superfamily protein [Planctomycetes bacterium Poly30]